MKHIEEMRTFKNKYRTKSWLLICYFDIYTALTREKHSFPASPHVEMKGTNKDKVTVETVNININAR